MKERMETLIENLQAAIADLEKVEEQIPLLYLQRAQGIFTCCGNVFYQNKMEQTYFLNDLIQFLNNILFLVDISQ